MNKRTVEEILAPKPTVRPRIYAYSIDDEAHKGLLKVGQTTRDVKQRVAEQHDLHRSPRPRSARQEKDREHRIGVDALHGQGR
jgi:hypothetical protein